MSTVFEYVNAHHESLVNAGEIGTSEPYQVYPDNTKGYVYIIHLAKPLAGSKSCHYVGFSKEPKKRLWHHRNNSGSHFLREANRQGIEYCMVVLFRGTKADERKLKNCKNTARYCPCCADKPREYKSPLHTFLPHERDYKFIDW